MLPMVDPTIPRTNSMSGINIPTTNVIAMTTMVMVFQRLGGMKSWPPLMTSLYPVLRNKRE